MAAVCREALLSSDRCDLSSSDCCSATGVSHSCGIHRSRKGTELDMFASRLTQPGISWPVRVYKTKKC